MLTLSISSPCWMSDLIHLFFLELKGKSSIMECDNFRRIQLFSHTFKQLGRIIDQKMKTFAKLRNIHVGFRSDIYLHW